jgi:cysteine desulfuration protein SufE
MTDTLSARIDRLEDEFALTDDPLERYELLIDKGRALPDLPDADKLDAFRVRGCQSQVWLIPERDGDALHFRGDSDALITRGLVALLHEALSGLPARDVREANLDFVQRLGLYAHLSPTRKNGLAAMLDRLRAAAA